MKITAFRATSVDIRFMSPYVYSHGLMKSLMRTIVEVDTNAMATATRRWETSRAFGGIEVAMWDARARIEEVPLHLRFGKVQIQIDLTEYQVRSRPTNNRLKQLPNTARA